MREIGWDDDSVKGGFGGPDKERQYRGKEGQKDYVRLMSKPLEYRTHTIDDILDIDPKTKEQKAFTVNCAKTWNKETQEWEGECFACEKEYAIANRYVAGLLFLGFVKGSKGSIQALDPANSVYWWDFAPNRYASLRAKQAELKEAEEPKELRQVELAITVEPNGESYQKLLLDFSQVRRLTTAAHVEAYREQGPAFLAEVAKPSDNKELTRRLKKKAGDTPAKDDAGPRADDDKPLEGSGGDDDLGLDDLPEEPAPPAKKATPAAKKPAPAAAAKAKPEKVVAKKEEPPPEDDVPEEEPVEEDGSAEDTPEEEAPPPPPKKATTPAKKPTAPAKAKVDDEDLDGMLDTLEAEEAKKR